MVERYGVPPELVTDLMGLRGDTSDNIPGVPGIGEKTAAQLLQKFGSLEEVLASVDEISGAKRKQNLVEHADDARMSKQLATLQYDIETGVDLGAAMAAEPDRGALREFMREFELRAVIERLEEALPEGEAVPGRSVETRARGRGGGGRRPADLAEGPVGAGDRRRALGGRRRRADRHRRREPRRARRRAGRPAARSATTSSRSAAAATACSPRPPARASSSSLDHDTMLAAYLLEPQRRTYELIELAADAGIGLAEGAAAPRPTRTTASSRSARRPRPASTRPRRRAWSRPWPRPSGPARGARPGAAAARGRAAAGPRAGGDGAGGAEARRRAPGRGRRRLRRADRRRSRRRSSSSPSEEFTIGSPQQVGRILFEELGLTRKRRGKTGFSTDARVLAQIRDEHPIVEKIESWRELTKLKNTYLDSLPDLIDPETGRVHTTFNQAATTTGRLSSTNPNLQNIPIRTEIGRPVRACFVAEQGARLLSADYSQVELRVLAHVADEEVLKEIFRAGDDVHAATAAEVFDISRDEVDVGQRSKAKMVNFGIVYGLTGFGLADRLNIPRKEGEEFVARYLERFPAVRAFREEIVERAQEEGYVTTLMGRRRPIPELRSGNPNTRRLGERLAVNTVIQGTAADIIKVAMVRCQRRAARGRDEDPPGPADPRRAALRGPAGGDGRRGRAGAARDVRRLPARPAARGRRRRRPGLARRQVAGLVGQLDLLEGRRCRRAPAPGRPPRPTAPTTRSAVVQLAPLPLSSWPLPLSPEPDGRPGPELSPAVVLAGSSPCPPWSSPGSCLADCRTPWPPSR